MADTTTKLSRIERLELELKEARQAQEEKDRRNQAQAVKDAHAFVESLARRRPPRLIMAAWAEATALLTEALEDIG